MAFEVYYDLASANPHFALNFLEHILCSKSYHLNFLKMTCASPPSWRGLNWSTICTFWNPSNISGLRLKPLPSGSIHKPWTILDHFSLSLTYFWHFSFNNSCFVTYSHVYIPLNEWINNCKLKITQNRDMLLLFSILNYSFI